MSTGPTTWLCPRPSDRDRLLDMDRRLKPRRVAAMLVLATALVTASFTGQIGWWTLVPLTLAGVGFAAADHAAERVARPEYAVGAAWLLSQLAIAASVALTGQVGSPATAWLVLPVVTLAARFNGRGVLAGVGATALLMVLSTAALEPAAALADPQAVLFPLALLLAVSILSTALMNSDVEHRSEAVIDPLTGMLNRGALLARVPELVAQAPINRRPVGLIVLDLDHFKAVNDEYGHTAGDAVLRDVAYRVRKELRAYDLAYRLGGEEFVVLLPGADMERAMAIAEALRVAVAVEVDGVPACTASLGVSASAPGRFDYEEVFAAADRALYMAKNEGRDTVRALAPGAQVSVSGSEPFERALA